MLFPSFKLSLFSICTMSAQDFLMCLLIKVSDLSDSRIAVLLGRGRSTISNITWSRTFEYKYRHNDTEHQHTDLGGLHAGEKSGYFKTEATSSPGS